MASRLLLRAVAEAAGCSSAGALLDLGLAGEAEGAGAQEEVQVGLC